MTTGTTVPGHLAVARWLPGRRARGWDRPVWVGAATVLILLSVWEVAAQVSSEATARIPAPSSIGAALGTLIGDGTLWAATAQTLISTGLGLAIATIAAVLAGIVCGTFVFVQRSTNILIELMRPIPPVALLPVGLLIFGTSLEMKLALVIYTAFWPVFIQTAYGMRDIDATLLDMARIHRVRRWRRLTGIVLPSIGGYVAIGLRLSVIGALIASIITELIGGAAGLGYILGIAQSTGQDARMYAIVFVIGFFGLAVNGVFGIFERRVLKWSHSNREGAQ